MGSISTEDTQLPKPKFDWQAAIRRKQQEIISKTPKQWILDSEFIRSLDCGPAKTTNLININAPRKSGILTQRELDITEKYTAVQLLERLRSKEFTSVEVTTAFCKRAAIAQQLLSCTTEVFYTDALERARTLDEAYETSGKVSGPLHGLPISVKDSFCVKGLQSTVGYASLLADAPANTNSALIEMLLDMGAVLYVKTNIPQTMMTADSENNIFGRTLNPNNTALTAGGSSGGEGSLVSFRGSILGVGTDIAGSIRIPALCCGVYGFKPTASRVPFGGQVSGAREGIPIHKPAAGPLAHSLDDVELFLSSVLSANPENYDSAAIEAHWRSVQPPQKLRIGVLPEEKIFPLHPPVRRAIENATKLLSSAGHEIITLPENPTCSVSSANLIAFAYYIVAPDPSSDEHFGPDGEPKVASVAAGSHPLFAGPLPIDMSQDPFTKINDLHYARRNYQESWRKWWLEHGIDVLLCPGAQNTAVPHDTYGWPPYTQIWNVLDYPACIIPFGKANKSLDPADVEGAEYGPQPRYVDVMEKIDGAPCAVQIVTRRGKDEECVAAAKVIDAVLRGQGS